jgi:YfiH family protein
MKTKIKSALRLYPFSLDFTRKNEAPRSNDKTELCACFPFIMNGIPLPGYFCAISSCKAGDMRFDNTQSPARETFFRSLVIDPARVYALMQVHSRDVFTVDKINGALPPREFVREGDGMVCGGEDVFLSVTVADCLPVFLLDTQSGAFAALHSGWRGTGIVRAALALMASHYGTRAEQVAAVLGPCIQSCCYRVDEERARAYLLEFSPNENTRADLRTLEPAALRRGEFWYIDMQAANVYLLAEAGVQHIACCTNCTFTDTNLGSYRREGADRYTRMAAITGKLTR